MPLGQSFAVKRAEWEAARRKGLSKAVHVTCDNWRDSTQTLWQPNAFAPVLLPTLKLAPPEPWVIAEVTYSVDPGRGTTAELLLMPRDAFLPEPLILTPTLPVDSPVGGGASAVPQKLLPGQEAT
jgi:prophage tail gpP-like protein